MILKKCWPRWRKARVCASLLPLKNTAQNRTTLPFRRPINGTPVYVKGLLHVTFSKSKLNIIRKQFLGSGMCEKWKLYIRIKENVARLASRKCVTIHFFFYKRHQFIVWPFVILPKSSDDRSDTRLKWQDQIISNYFYPIILPLFSKLFSRVAVHSVRYDQI